MIRKLALSDKKERGINRKLRNLQKWSEGFKNYFPDLTDCNQRYLNWKIPVPNQMIQGKHAQKDVQMQCIQLMLNACDYLIQAKPSQTGFCKVCCLIVLPDLFASEICIYLDEDYFHSHTRTGGYVDSAYAFKEPTSLAQLYQLFIPSRMYEHGIHFEYRVDFDSSEMLYCEHWFYCEK